MVRFSGCSQLRSVLPSACWTTRNSWIFTSRCRGRLIALKWVTITQCIMSTLFFFFPRENLFLDFWWLRLWEAFSILTPGILKKFPEWRWVTFSCNYFDILGHEEIKLPPGSSTGVHWMCTGLHTYFLCCCIVVPETPLFCSAGWIPAICCLATMKVAFPLYTWIVQQKKWQQQQRKRLTIDIHFVWQRFLRSKCLMIVLTIEAKGYRTQCLQFLCWLTIQFWLNCFDSSQERRSSQDGGSINQRKCSPKTNVEYIKTLKTGSSTLSNIMSRWPLTPIVFNIPLLLFRCIITAYQKFFFPINGWCEQGKSKSFTFQICTETQQESPHPWSEFWNWNPQKNSWQKDRKKFHSGKLNGVVVGGIVWHKAHLLMCRFLHKYVDISVLWPSEVWFPSSQGHEPWCCENNICERPNNTSHVCIQILLSQ